jgi:hypothetical protein
LNFQEPPPAWRMKDEGHEDCTKKELSPFDGADAPKEACKEYVSRPWIKSVFDLIQNREAAPNQTKLKSTNQSKPHRIEINT